MLINVNDHYDINHNQRTITFKGEKVFKPEDGALLDYKVEKDTSLILLTDNILFII